MFMPVTLTILCLQLFNLIAHALPLEPRIVFNPHITVPNEQTSWKVGSQETVTWDPTGLPDETLTGQAVLGFLEGDSLNEHLMLDNPLAKGFLLKDGQVQITVPDVPERDSYIVVVFGDSGNASPRFAITGGGNATSSSASPSTVPSSTIVASSTSATIVPPITTSGTAIHTVNPTSTDITLTVTTGTSPPSTVATVTSSGPAPTVIVPSSAPLSSAASESITAASTVTDTADSQGTSAPANAPSNGAMRTSIELIYSVIAATTILLFTVA